MKDELQSTKGKIIFFSSMYENHSKFSFPCWNNRGQDKIPKSSSIDSMVDIVWNNDNESNHVTIPKHLTVQETSNRRESLLSPRRTKQSRGINCKSSSILYWMSLFPSFESVSLSSSFSIQQTKYEREFSLYLHMTSTRHSLSSENIFFPFNIKTLFPFYFIRSVSQSSTKGKKNFFSFFSHFRVWVRAMCIEVPKWIFYLMSDKVTQFLRRHSNTLFR